MPCFHPLLGYRSREINASGKRSLVFSPRDGYSDLPVTVPCGQCIGCRLERSRQWAVRCVHEASLHDSNCFITLTFNDQNLPDDGSLHVEDFQKFMKRLRKFFDPDLVRFFHCGEYGDRLGRPHHHACLFGVDFPDKELFSVRDDVPLYRSAILERLWPFGYCTIGDVTFESAAYVARYVLKKVTGDSAVDYYEGRKPPYVTMSRRPGIAYSWIKKYSSDVYPHDYLVIRDGVKCRPPKYYDNIYDIDYSIDKVKSARKVAGNRFSKTDEASLARLAVKEECKKLASKQLKRSYENEA